MVGVRAENGLNLAGIKPGFGGAMEESEIINGLKVVCKCHGIKKRIFLQHIESGIQTIEDLQKITGAGSGACQGKQCTPRIIDLLQLSKTNLPIDRTPS